MTAAQRRLKLTLGRVDEAFTVGGSTRHGVFAILTGGQASTLLGYDAASILGHPIRVLYVPFDDATAEGNTVVYAGSSLTVHKALDLRLRGEVVARLLVLA